jgi:serine/threonine protein kinase
MTTVSYDPDSCKRWCFEAFFEDVSIEGSAQKKTRTFSQSYFFPQHAQGLDLDLAPFLATDRHLAAIPSTFRVDPLLSDLNKLSHDAHLLSDEHKTLSATLDPKDPRHHPIPCEGQVKKGPLRQDHVALAAALGLMPVVGLAGLHGACALPREIPLDFLPCVIPFAQGVVHISRMLGSGVYGQVYRAQFLCSKTNTLLDVALKINRVFAEKAKTLLYRECLKKEASILFELSKKDVEDSMPVGRYVDLFDLDENRFLFLQKLCYKDLYTILKQTNSRGVSFTSLCHMTLDLVKGLKFLQDQHPPILHADIKPENIMRISEDSEKLRIVDFSVSMRGPQRNLSTRDVVSLFYRPPEVVLGRPYDAVIDNWAVACVLFEMYTGKPLFPARDNKELLCMLIEFLGPIPSSYAIQSRRFIDSFAPSTSLENHVELLPQLQVHDKWENRRSYFERKLSRKIEREGSQEDHVLFRDFILQSLTWDPDERPSLEALSQHPFYLKAQEIVGAGSVVI